MNCRTLQQSRDAVNIIYNIYIYKYIYIAHKQSRRMDKRTTTAEHKATEHSLTHSLTWIELGWTVPLALLVLGIRHTLSHSDLRMTPDGVGEVLHKYTTTYINVYIYIYIYIHTYTMAKHIQHCCFLITVTCELVSGCVSWW